MKFSGFKNLQGLINNPVILVSMMHPGLHRLSRHQNCSASPATMTSPPPPAPELHRLPHHQDFTASSSTGILPPPPPKTLPRPPPRTSPPPTTRISPPLPTPELRRLRSSVFCCSPGSRALMQPRDKTAVAGLFFAPLLMYLQDGCSSAH